MRHCYQMQRLSMKAQALLWCRPYQCQLNYCTYIFILNNLMKNWSLENVSDGYGRNLVRVYVSILSIIQFNNLCTVLDMVKYFSALNLLTLCISFILRETGPPSINQTLTTFILRATFIVSALPFVPSDVWKKLCMSGVQIASVVGWLDCVPWWNVSHIPDWALSYHCFQSSRRHCVSQWVSFCFICQ